MRSDLLVFFEPAVACDIVRFRQITVSQEAFLTVRQDALRPLGRPFIAKGPEIVGGCRSGLLEVTNICGLLVSCCSSGATSTGNVERKASS